MMPDEQEPDPNRGPSSPGISAARVGHGPPTRPTPGTKLWDDTQRLTLPTLLLENVGVDQAVRLSDPEDWRAAVRDLG